MRDMLSNTGPYLSKKINGINIYYTNEGVVSLVFIWHAYLSKIVRLSLILNGIMNNDPDLNYMVAENK